MLPKLDRPNILDAGSGTGVPTIHLAQLSGGTIMAIDTDRTALAKLTEKIVDKELMSRVRVMNVPMENLPFDQESFDIVWAEGSISHLGFKAALEILGKYVKTDGFLVLHDDADACFEKMSMVRDMGFLLLGFFLLSDTVWWDEFYHPLEEGLAGADSVCAPYSLENIKQELEQIRNEPERFRSAFFVAKKTPSVLSSADW
jgi:SAM-dependent methyltransferase